MWITLNFTQEDIDNAGHYFDNNNCLGCIALKRILGVDNMCVGGLNLLWIGGVHVRIPMSDFLFDKTGLYPSRPQ